MTEKIFLVKEIDGHCDWNNSEILTKEEIELIKRWVSAGDYNTKTLFDKKQNLLKKLEKL